MIGTLVLKVCEDNGHIRRYLKAALPSFSCCCNLTCEASNCFANDPMCTSQMKRSCRRRVSWQASKGLRSRCTLRSKHPCHTCSVPSETLPIQNLHPHLRAFKYTHAPCSGGRCDSALFGQALLGEAREKAILSSALLLVDARLRGSVLPACARNKIFPAIANSLD